MVGMNKRCGFGGFGGAFYKFGGARFISRGQMSVDKIEVIMQDEGGEG